MWWWRVDARVAGVEIGLLILASFTNPMFKASPTGPLVCHGRLSLDLIGSSSEP